MSPGAEGLVDRTLWLLMGREKLNRPPRLAETSEGARFSGDIACEVAGGGSSMAAMAGECKGEDSATGALCDIGSCIVLGPLSGFRGVLFVCGVSGT